MEYVPAATTTAVAAEERESARQESICAAVWRDNSRNSRIREGGGGTEMDFGISISANEKRMSIFLTRQRDTGGNISGVCCRGARWKYDGGYGDDAISDGREKADQAAKRYVFVVRRAARTPSLRREDRGRGRTRDPPTGFMKSQM